MKKIYSLLYIVAMASSIFAADPDEGTPWFTGPLLTPSPYTVDPGHINVEPYVFYSDTNGFYDGHSNRKDVVSYIQWYEQIPIQIGIAKGLEFDLVPSVYTNSKSDKSSTFLGDTLAALHYQAYKSPKNFWFPSIKVGARVLFPTGNFDRFNPSNSDVQSSGGGCYSTTFTLGLGKAYHMYQGHYINFRTYFGYTYSFPTHVEGFNTYGGGYGTYGTVYPGNSFTWLLGLEYNLTRNWVLAFDLQYSASNKTSFDGVIGTVNPISESEDPVAAEIGSPSNWQWSIAPAIEYNFNTNWGIIAGPWFTIAGKNTGAFISVAAAVNIWY